MSRSQRHPGLDDHAVAERIDRPDLVKPFQGNDNFLLSRHRDLAADEADAYRREVRAKSLETDYGMEDAGQLKTRVEAFVETLR